MDVGVAQDEVCRRFGVAANRPDPGAKVGASRNLRDDTTPLNGLRHAEQGDHSGWYLWRGEALGGTPNFFVPLHLEHLGDWSPDALPYLALPPGWRFLLAPDYEDVWFDGSLLDV